MTDQIEVVEMEGDDPTIPCSWCGKPVYDDGTGMHVGSLRVHCEGQNIIKGKPFMPLYRRVVIKYSILGFYDVFDLTDEYHWQELINIVGSEGEAKEILKDLFCRITREPSSLIRTPSNSLENIQKFEIVDLKSYDE